MNIAITAVSGHLGAAIAEATRKLMPDNTIVGLARTPEKAKHLQFEVRPGDYNDLATLTQSLTAIDVLLLVSGMDAPEKRIAQHRNVIQAAKDAGVRKIVYTSIQGAERDTSFSPVVNSNRQTEQDIQESGLEFVIGRNGIYIEPDIEYIDQYKKSGEVSNCAGFGRCGYTTRSELAFAYAKMLTEDKHNGQVYNLHGEAITQQQLVQYLNQAFALDLSYRSMTVEEYKENRVDELGPFLGVIIAGIYQGIRMGKCDNPSHYAQAAGREHESWPAYFARIGSNTN